MCSRVCVCGRFMSACAQERVRARAMFVRTDMMCMYMAVAVFCWTSRYLRIAVAATTPTPGPFEVASSEARILVARFAGATMPRLAEIPFARIGEQH